MTRLTVHFSIFHLMIYKHKNSIGDELRLGVIKIYGGGCGPVVRLLGCHARARRSFPATAEKCHIMWHCPSGHGTNYAWRRVLQTLHSHGSGYWQPWPLPREPLISSYVPDWPLPRRLYIPSEREMALQARMMGTCRLTYGLFVVLWRALGVSDLSVWRLNVFHPI